MPLPGSTQRINQPSCQKLTHADRGGQREAEGAAPTGSPTPRANSMHYWPHPLSLSQSTPLSTSFCLNTLVSFMVTVHLMLSVHSLLTLRCPFFIYANHINCNSKVLIYHVVFHKDKRKTPIMAIEIYDLSCSSCRHTYMHTDASCLTVSCITSGNLWLFFLAGAWRKRECK